MAGIAVLPVIWRPPASHGHLETWVLYLLAGTGAALGAAAASLKPGPFRSPGILAALLAALIPMGALWLADKSPDLRQGRQGLSDVQDRARADMDRRMERGDGYGYGSGYGDARESNASSSLRADAALRGTDGRGADGKGASDSVREARYNETSAVLALAPLFLFLFYTRLTPKLPALLFLGALAVLAGLFRFYSPGVWVFWSMVAFLALPELLRASGKPLFGFFMLLPAAAGVFMGERWDLLGPCPIRLVSLGWIAFLGLLAFLIRFGELRRFQAAVVRARLAEHPLALGALPRGAAGPSGGRAQIQQGQGQASGSPAARTASGKAMAPVALVLCRRPPSMDRAMTSKGLTCATLDTLSGGPWSCPEACLGGGDCIASCPSGAMAEKTQGSAPVADHALCTGCGLCVSSCPKGLITLVPRAWKAAIPCRGRRAMKAMDSLCPCGCLGCGLCRKACPKAAIEWRAPRGLAQETSSMARRNPQEGPSSARGPRSGSKPSINQSVCLDPEGGGCALECRVSCPRSIIVARMPGAFGTTS
jgi:ferredoxin